ncbi:MAG: alpha-amylase family protein [Muribaculaceae bacterium]|nr:alpha-amylase family protein [Muribaculaceae bacterium]
MTQQNIKPIIYQMLPRLWSNNNRQCVKGGTIEQNGSGKLNDITPRALKAIKELGTTHVWYTGVIEHAHCSDYSAWGITKDNPHIVKGQAGSPYAISDYYDIDPDIATDIPNRVKEFEDLVKRTHDAGMKVIIDFVPNHVARRYHSDAAPAAIEDLGHGDNCEMFFSPANNFYYITRQQFAPVDVDLGSGADAYVEFPAKASGNDCFTAFPGKYDWYETVKLNYGIDPANGSRHFDPIPPTWFKMLHILRYWASKGVDAFRCDMAHMVPVEFWQWAISRVKETYPDVEFIAELYEVGIYRQYIFDGGFDYLYDKVNLYDTLRAVECYNHSAATITNCWQTVDGLSRHMLNFLENHDEQRFGSPQYAGDPLRVVPSLVVSSMIGTGPMMIYMGQELGEQALDAEGYSGLDGRTTIFDYWSLDTLSRWNNNGKWDNRQLHPQEKSLRDTYAKVLNLCNSEQAIARGSFFDLMYVNYNNPAFNPHRHYAFMRNLKDDAMLLIVVNFDSSDSHVELNIPLHAFEILEIKQEEAEMTELLTGKKGTFNLTSEAPVHLDIPAKGAVVWKLDYKKSSKTTRKKSTISKGCKQ